MSPTKRLHEQAQILDYEILILCFLMKSVDERI